MAPTVNCSTKEQVMTGTSAVETDAQRSKQSTELQSAPDCMQQCSTSPQTGIVGPVRQHAVLAASYVEPLLTSHWAPVDPP